MCSFSAEQTIDWLGMINAAFADIVGYIDIKAYKFMILRDIFCIVNLSYNFYCVSTLSLHTKSSNPMIASE